MIHQPNKNFSRSMRQMKFSAIRRNGRNMISMARIGCMLKNLKNTASNRNNINNNRVEEPVNEQAALSRKVIFQNFLNLCSVVADLEWVKMFLAEEVKPLDAEVARPNSEDRT